MALPAGTGVVAYNAAISRCARAGLYARALALFREMRGRGLRADEYTLPPLLNSAALMRGPPPAAVAALHALLLRAGLVLHLHVANALVDAYTRLPRAGGGAGGVRRNAAPGRRHLDLAPHGARARRRPRRGRPRVPRHGRRGGPARRVRRRGGPQLVRGLHHARRGPVGARRRGAPRAQPVPLGRELARVHVRQDRRGAPSRGRHSSSGTRRTAVAGSRSRSTPIWSGPGAGRTT
jgi:pentatricopeptide repeat protein